MWPERDVASFTQIRTCVLEKLMDFLLQVKGIRSVVTWPCILHFFHLLRCPLVTPLLRELHWWPVCSLIEFKLLLITFKVLKGLALLYLSQLIFLFCPHLVIILEGTLIVHCYALLNLNLSTSGDRAFSSVARILWNSFPFAIRNGMLTSLSSHLRRNLRPIYTLEFLPSNSRNSFFCP